MTYIERKQDNKLHKTKKNCKNEEIKKRSPFSEKSRDTKSNDLDSETTKDALK